VISGERTVTIFGSSRPNPGDEQYRLAQELGRALAERGWTICNGGYGGTMEAAARGAKQAGGKTIGVTCKVFSRSGPNAYIDREEVTSTLMQRLQRLIDLGDAYVILPGGTGTLVELAIVWELLNKHLLPAKPAVVFGDHWLPVLTVAGRDKPGSEKLLQRADSVGQVCELLDDG